jgi:16S rRNA (adenine1518-N6/adenine1519-N6)-dimethyltransferase
VLSRENGETGAITYAINYYTEPSEVCEVLRESFLPVPEVDSKVIRLKVLETPSVKVKNEKLLFQIIKASFMQRRKTLLNSLSNSNLLGSKENIEKILVELGFDTLVRGEKLTLEDFSKISDYIQNH